MFLNPEISFEPTYEELKREPKALYKTLKSEF